MFVQFRINCIQKIHLTAKFSGLGERLRPILAVLGIFFTQLFPNWPACSPITLGIFWVGICRPGLQIGTLF